MNSIMGINPGYSHIGQKILTVLDHQSQMNCRLVNPDWKAQMDHTYFWIQKCNKKGQSKELHDAWIDLVQRIERRGHLAQDLVECLMKWYGYFPSLHQDMLNRCTIMHVAVFKSNIRLVEFIASYMNNPNPQMDDGATPLFHVCSNGIQIEIVKFLVSKVENPNEGMHNGATPIYLAAQNGHINFVKLLATKIENPNAPSYNEFTPLHIAAENGHTEVVKYFATRAENPNLSGPNGKTPLKLALEYQHADVVKVLLQQICYKFETDPMSYRNIPLKLAIESLHADAVKVLLQQICYKFETDPKLHLNMFR